jgi:pyruvate dehydrogenase E2 component (dihydrolipoamide acetyltransferase)
MTTIKMPQLGETIVEGTILKWLKQEGETIERDEPLFEISTDKVDTEVPSSVGGTVTKILVQEGQTVPVGTDLAEVSEDGAGGGETSGGQASSESAPQLQDESTPEPEPETEPERAPETAKQGSSSSESADAVAEGSASEMPAVEPATAQGAEATAASGTAPAQAAAASAPDGGSGELPDRGPRSRILSPLVRRLADEHGLDLSRVEGSGTGGRITKKDVLAAIEGGGATAAPATAEVPAAAPAPAPAAATAPAPQAVAGPDEEVTPVSHIRKLIGQHMVASLQTSARAWTMVEVNVDHLVKLRERAKESFKAKHGVNLTYLPFVIRATCDALMTHPEVNSSLRGDEIVRHRAVHMGIAVSYDEGLIVPVIKGADSMNTVGLARVTQNLESRDFAEDVTV